MPQSDALSAATVSTAPQRIDAQISRKNAASLSPTLHSAETSCERRHLF